MSEEQPYRRAAFVLKSWLRAQYGIPCPGYACSGLGPSVPTMAGEGLGMRRWVGWPSLASSQGFELEDSTVAGAPSPEVEVPS